MILYFGNILSSSGNNPSFIELLVPKLKESYQVECASSRKNKIVRLMDMIVVFLKYRRTAKAILIDTYSYQGFYYALVIGFLCVCFKKKYFPIIRGGDFLKRLERSPGTVGFFLRHASKIVSPSEFMYHRLNERGFSVEFIPNFIDTSDYTFKTRSTLQPRLFWVRSFHKIYNPLMAVEIVETLKQQFDNAYLCMAGPDKDGSLPMCKEYVNARGLDSIVDFPGKLTKEQIRELSDKFDIFINTTTVDNHPVSVIEAMALGLTVVSTNVGGMPFLITHEDNGLLVEPGHPKAFTRAIIRLMNDSELAMKLQKNARDKIEKYDWVYVKDKWSRLLNPYLK